MRCIGGKALAVDINRRSDIMLMEGAESLFDIVGTAGKRHVGNLAVRVTIETELVKAYAGLLGQDLVIVGTMSIAMTPGHFSVSKAGNRLAAIDAVGCIGMGRIGPGTVDLPFDVRNCFAITEGGGPKTGPCSIVVVAGQTERF